MRYSFSILLVITLFIGCKKDKFTTAPQISYKKITPNVYRTNQQIFSKIISRKNVHMLFIIIDQLGYIIKLVYKNHPWEPNIVAVVDRWLLLRGKN